MPRMKDDERKLREAVEKQPHADPLQLAAKLKIRVGRAKAIIRRMPKSAAKEKPVVTPAVTKKPQPIMEKVEKKEDGEIQGQ